MKIRYPDFFSIYYENWFSDGKFDTVIKKDDISVETMSENNCLNIYLSADKTPVKYLRLFWHFKGDEKRKENVRVLGDEWERTYGKTSWQGIVARRCMPWVCSVSNGTDSNTDYTGRFTECFGVKVRPNAMCFWQYDTSGITLWIDTRCGGVGVVLSGRKIELCSITFGEYRDMSAFDAVNNFYKTLCCDKLEVNHKIYGTNNWYYAYGRSSHEDIIKDTELLAEMCSKNENPPYMVIDSGWEENSSSGPWDKSRASFPDMKRLADEIKAYGVRPGIWVRPLSDIKGKLKLFKDGQRISYNKQYLDPSHPSVLEYIEDFISVISKDWGYKLIKHDFTTYDMFGFWGFERDEIFAADGWSFYDKGKTSAEIIKNLYKAIYDSAAEGTVILGCNVIGHLAAGYAHVNRVGDDTSGVDWERTRNYGVNTLAFRMCHKAFFEPDVDCVGVTERIDWKLNRNWLDIVAKSGTPLFVSPKPSDLTDEIRASLVKAYKINSIQTDVLKPLDWMENAAPDRWLLNGKEIKYNWYPESGIKSIEEKVVR